MPIYEYFCNDCHQRVSVFFRTFSSAQNDTAYCPECEGKQLQRIVSRVRTLRSDEGRMGTQADDSTLMAGLESEDPQARAGLMRRMSDETGEPLDDEMSEVIGRLEAGEAPESIEQAISTDNTSDGNSLNSNRSDIKSSNNGSAGGGSGGFS